MLGKHSRVENSANGAAQISTRLETIVARGNHLARVHILQPYIKRPVSERARLSRHFCFSCDSLCASLDSHVVLPDVREI